MKGRDWAAPVLAAVLLVLLAAVRQPPELPAPPAGRYCWQSPRAQQAQKRFEELTSPPRREYPTPPEKESPNKKA